MTRNGHEVKVGVITVPSFYQDYDASRAGAKDYRSTTRDVQRLHRKRIAGAHRELGHRGSGVPRRERPRELIAQGTTGVLREKREDARKSRAGDHTLVGDAGELFHQISEYFDFNLIARSESDMAALAGHHRLARPVIDKGACAEPRTGDRGRTVRGEQHERPAWDLE